MTTPSLGHSQRSSRTFDLLPWSTVIVIVLNSASLAWAKEWEGDVAGMWFSAW